MEPLYLAAEPYGKCQASGAVGGFSDSYGDPLTLKKTLFQPSDQLKDSIVCVEDDS